MRHHTPLRREMVLLVRRTSHFSEYFSQQEKLASKSMNYKTINSAGHPRTPAKPRNWEWEGGGDMELVLYVFISKDGWCRYRLPSIWTIRGNVDITWSMYLFLIQLYALGCKKKKSPNRTDVIKTKNLPTHTRVEGVGRWGCHAEQRMGGWGRGPCTAALCSLGRIPRGALSHSAMQQLWGTGQVMLFLGFSGWANRIQGHRFIREKANKEEDITATEEVF